MLAKTRDTLTAVALGYCVFLTLAGLRSLGKDLVQLRKSRRLNK